MTRIHCNYFPFHKAEAVFFYLPFVILPFTIYATLIMNVDIVLAIKQLLIELCDGLKGKKMVLIMKTIDFSTVLSEKYEIFVSLARRNHTCMKIIENAALPKGQLLFLNLKEKK
mgnify:CR=1 FL=1